MIKTSQRKWSHVNTDNAYQIVNNVCNIKIQSQGSSAMWDDQATSGLCTSVSQERRRRSADREDHFLCECEGWLRHLLFHTSGISLLAHICIHFCQDGHKVNTTGGKKKMQRDVPSQSLYLHLQHFFSSIKILHDYIRWLEGIFCTERSPTWTETFALLALRTFFSLYNPEMNFLRKIY